MSRVQSIDTDRDGVVKDRQGFAVLEVNVDRVVRHLVDATEPARAELLSCACCGVVLGGRAVQLQQSPVLYFCANPTARNGGLRTTGVRPVPLSATTPALAVMEFIDACSRWTTRVPRLTRCECAHRFTTEFRGPKLFADPVLFLAPQRPNDGGHRLHSCSILGWQVQNDDHIST